jgi:hypothetical protein
MTFNFDDIFKSVGDDQVIVGTIMQRHQFYTKSITSFYQNVFRQTGQLGVLELSNDPALTAELQQIKTTGQQLLVELLEESTKIKDFQIRTTLVDLLSDEVFLDFINS